jgi:hypothetical protein
MTERVKVSKTGAQMIPAGFMYKSIQPVWLFKAMPAPSQEYPLR